MGHTNINKLVQFWITTSPAPWHPSTEIIERTLESTWELIGEKVRPVFYADGRAPWITDEDWEAYKGYLQKLWQWGRVLEMETWIGLVGLYQRFIRAWLTAPEHKIPLVLTVQHDWEFIKPKRVQFGKLVQLMTSTGPQCVRFHKRPLPQSNGYVDREYYELSLEEWNNVPLIKTDGWGDSPHLATRNHYIWISQFLTANDYSKDYGRYGVEGPVWQAYRRDKQTMGFAKAWADWSSCIYGRFGDRGYVRHLGGDATRWRKERCPDNVSSKK